MKTVAFHTLGCKLNFSETSTIKRQLIASGLIESSFNEGADLFIINTCSVTENANKECRRLIRKAKKISPNSRVIITGCYAQLKPESIIEIDGVDLVIGAKEKFNIFKYLANFKKGIHGCEINNLDYFPSFSIEERSRSYVKVQDGCNYPCTYCTIPLARGKSRSDFIKNIISKIENIGSKGTKEVVLTGVNIGDYKEPISNKNFYDLIKEIEKVDVIDRFRISSIEPNLITDEIIDFVKNSKKFVPHFHIPLQSGSDNILKSMKRRYNTSMYINRIKRIKEKIENVCIGADVIVGFPNETEEEFEKTFKLIKNLKLSYLHVFSFSERENTLATEMKGKIDKFTISKRSKRLRILSEKLKYSYYRKFSNIKKEIIVEDKNKNGYQYGFTDNYLKVRILSSKEFTNKKIKVQLGEIKEDCIFEGNPILKDVSKY